MEDTKFSYHKVRGGKVHILDKDKWSFPRDKYEARYICGMGYSSIDHKYNDNIRVRKTQVCKKCLKKYLKITGSYPEPWMIDTAEFIPCELFEI